MSACPYKKVYINHQTGKAEKCTFCFPRIEEGLPTVCAETCVGRLRYIGIVFYDADKVSEAASVTDEKDLLDSQRDIILNPFDPEVLAAARAEGIPEDWIKAAQDSPIYKLIHTYKIALPLHPEYRTLPMVWYVPPLSPVLDVTTELGRDNTDADDVFHTISSLRIPMEYLASIFTAGDVDTIAGVLMKLAGMRTFMRNRTINGDVSNEVLERIGMSAQDVEDMYRLLAIAKMSDRYVIPKAHTERAAELASWQSGCSLDGPGGPGMSNVSTRGGKVPLTLARRRPR